MIVRRLVCRIRLRFGILGILSIVITVSILKPMSVFLHAKGENYTGVVILTYMRSGSSVTGDILQQNNNVFYVFEPLRILQDLIKHEKPVQWFNGTISVMNSLIAADVKRQTLIGWLSCNFSLVYAQSFDDLGFLAFGKQTTLYRTCVLRNHNSTINYPGQNISRVYIRTSAFHRGLHDECLQSLQNACLSSKVRIIKTIRTSMLDMEAILSDIKWFKVITVIRDPRYTVLSQLRNDACSDVRNVTLNCAKRHCDRVWNDTLVKAKLQRDSNNKILTVKYGKLVANPTLQTKIMYDFIGMELSQKIMSYVKRIVLERNVTGCKICEQSWQAGNHFRTTTKFQKTANRRAFTDIENVCRNVLTYYNYTI
ncbi:carbohydrate sulfotransferase 3-like isoform X2 [Ruditapes philippinarum]|uniref:carbohydrate sulfotransferase 3-like isoform X2 n=1 Tax=Ruditapes philippinarum TaxID=129788 RepID=UPI00295BECE9|nr:carbohydrate sulfotransferase 3-like isoform X2 [Ruditapes philippinarum]